MEKRPPVRTPSVNDLQYIIYETENNIQLTCSCLRPEQKNPTILKGYVCSVAFKSITHMAFNDVSDACSTRGNRVECEGYYSGTK